MKAYLSWRLYRVDRAVFGLAIELAKLDPEGAIENKSIFADCLAAGERILQAAHPELVLDRTKDKRLAQEPSQRLQRAATLTVQLARLGSNRPVHEEMVQPFLERSRIFHADLDRCQHLVPTSWCRQIEGRCDFPHIAHDRFLPLRHVHGKSPKQRRPDSNSKVTHPGHRQIGEDFLVLVEGARSMAIPRRR